MNKGDHVRLTDVHGGVHEGVIRGINYIEDQACFIVFLDEANATA